MGLYGLHYEDGQKLWLHWLPRHSGKFRGAFDELRKEGMSYRQRSDQIRLLIITVHDANELSWRLPGWAYMQAKSHLQYANPKVLRKL